MSYMTQLSAENGKLKAELNEKEEKIEILTHEVTRLEEENKLYRKAYLELLKGAPATSLLRELTQTNIDIFHLDCGLAKISPMTYHDQMARTKYDDMQSKKDKKEKRRAEILEELRKLNVDLENEE